MILCWTLPYTNDKVDAKEGLKLHGTSYHGKKLKVEQSDPNFNNKKAARYVDWG